VLPGKTQVPLSLPQRFSGDSLAVSEVSTYHPACATSAQPGLQLPTCNPHAARQAAGLILAVQPRCTLLCIFAANEVKKHNRVESSKLTYNRSKVHPRLVGVSDRLPELPVTFAIQPTGLLRARARKYQQHNAATITHYSLPPTASWPSAAFNQP
jgi:hypothetical protein